MNFTLNESIEAEHLLCNFHQLLFIPSRVIAKKLIICVANYQNISWGIVVLIVQWNCNYKLLIIYPLTDVSSVSVCWQVGLQGLYYICTSGTGWNFNQMWHCTPGTGVMGRPIQNHEICYSKWRIALEKSIFKTWHTCAKNCFLLTTLLPSHFQ